MLWARVEEDIVLEYRNSDPKGSFAKGVTWVLVPTSLEHLGYTDLKYVDGKFLPLDVEGFDRFLFGKVAAQAAHYLHNAFVDYKGTRFNNNRDLINDMTVKYLIGLSVENNRYREKYKTYLDVDSKCVPMNTADLMHVLKTMDSRKTVILAKQSEIQKKITDAQTADEKINLATFIL